MPPLGGLTTIGLSEFDHLFQSPGPIYEPARSSRDWWRIGRFLHAVGIGPDDVVQNCFGYHQTPAGHMFDNGAAAIGGAIHCGVVEQRQVPAPMRGRRIT